MRYRVVGLSFLPLLIVLLAISACNTRNSPTQPASAGSGAATGGGGTSSTASLTASIAAPRPLTPVQNAPIRNQDQPVTLVAQNAIVTRTIATTYTFEVATDAAFANKVQVKDGIAEGGGGQTGIRLDMPLAAAKDYYWRVRATAGATTGVFGAISKFTIGPATTLSPPAPIAPLTGAQTVLRPTFTVSNAAHTGPITGGITYRFEIADNAAFNPILVTNTVGEGPSQTSFTPPTDLTANKTYTWRAIAIDQSDGIVSTPSQLQVFTPTAASGGGSGGSAAGNIAAQQGVTLWPGSQPSGSYSHAVLGVGWGIHTETAFYGGTFTSPTLEALRIFDLLDRGFDPDGAINWMRQNGYPTEALYFASSAAIGLGPPEGLPRGAQYMAFINGRWELVHRVGA